MALSIRPPSVPYYESGRFGLWTGYFFTINCVVGAGFLSIPWAFQRGGWVFCLIFQLLVSGVSMYLSKQLLEVMSRVEVLQRMKEEDQKVPTVRFCEMFTQKGEELLPQTHHTPEITARRFDITEIVRIIFGEKWSIAYLFCMVFYNLGIQLAYSSIFAVSFASNVPLGTLGTCDIYQDEEFFTDCRWKYWVYLGVFFVCMLYLTIKGVEEQVWFQSAMTFVRFIVMTLVIVTCVFDIAYHQHNESSDYNSIDTPSYFDFDYVGNAIPIILFASFYHNQIPTITEHVRERDKNLPKIISMTTVTCVVFYLALGLIVPFAIDDLPSMSTLSYRNYSAGHDESDKPWWTYIVEYIIIIFPAIDVFSAFPLQGIPLADNMLSLKYGALPKNAIPRGGLLFFRSLVVVLPVLIAFFEFNLGQILDFVGMVGFLMVPVTIPILHLASRKLLEKESTYDVKPSSPWLSASISFAHIPLLLLVLVLNIKYP